jgi:LmbE family N-acetylglucosaminyl deacetylase
MRAILTLIVLLSTTSAVVADPLEPARTGGAATIAHELRCLTTTGRILVIGAHPDDEDTTLLAWYARGVGAQAAYLSLSRGEGGQNRYGAELGDGLGLLRSRELEAARRLDGARQYFTRASDFGFSKTLDEALRFWPEEELLRDAVRIVRKLRPQVIVSIFPASPLAGHGQHQVAGLIAERVLDAAADPTRFPELASDEGLLPWRAEAVYRRAWRDPENATHQVRLAHLDPFSGRSFQQIAMESRSLHRSQDMGQLESLGHREIALAWVAGNPAPEGAEPFAGLELRPRQLAQSLAPGAAREEVVARLETVEALANEALSALRPTDLEAVFPFLSEIATHLDVAVTTLRPSADADLEAAWVLAELERRQAGAARALAAAAGLVWDATARTEAVVAPGTIEVDVTVWNAGSRRVSLPELAVTLWSPSGWSEIQGVGFAAEPRAVTVAPGQVLERSVAVRLRPDAPITAPAHLLRPKHGQLYDWAEVAAAGRGEPFGRPGLEARLSVEVEGVRLRLDREVVARFRDQELGEVRRPLRVVPAIEVEVEPEVIVHRQGSSSPIRVAVVLTNRTGAVQRGRVEALLAEGPIDLPFELAGGERRTVTLELPSPSEPGATEVVVRARRDDGAIFDLAVPLIDHPHVAPIPWPRRAQVHVAAVPLELPQRRIGWIRGPGEDLPERLAALGGRGRVLDTTALEAGSFHDLEVIVIGSRAWETEPALPRANPGLLEWVENGGVLITLYQRYPYFEGPPRGPESFTLARPIGRVVDETAPLRPLDPAHPLWLEPNLLDPIDQQGWIQERGLFFPSSWGPALRPFVAIADPGEDEQLGAILAMQHGRGAWIYTGLAFFRQLPEGVPGAWRLFANLLALGPDDVPAVDPPSSPPAPPAEVLP